MMSASNEMRDYALAKTAELFDSCAKHLDKAAKSADEEAVHKMRVSIRRLQQALRIFAQYLDAKGIDSLKAELRGIMKVAGEVRNRDVAMRLISEAGGDARGFEVERAELNEQLLALVKRHVEAVAPAHWRKRLLP
jgi:CHAD domain-containing protein